MSSTLPKGLTKLYREKVRKQSLSIYLQLRTTNIFSLAYGELAILIGALFDLGVYNNARGL